MRNMKQVAAAGRNQEFVHFAELLVLTAQHSRNPFAVTRIFSKVFKLNIGASSVQH